MRNITLFIFLLVIRPGSYGQSIDYTVPGNFEKSISKDDYKKIIDAAVAIVAAKYRVETVKNAEMRFNTGEETNTVNMSNLVLECIDATDRSAWNKIIRDYFDKLFVSLEVRKKIDPANYESIKQYLTIRIYPSEIIDRNGVTGAVIIRNDLEGTYSILMLDLPGAFTPVNRSIYNSWKKDSSEVFRVALDNIDKQKVEKVTKTIPFDGVNIEICLLGEENYAGSYALDLMNNSPEFVGEWGSVVAIPNKGLVDVCKISKDKPVDFVKFIQMTKPLIEQSYREHPQRISDQYFWYYKGKFTRIDVQTDAKGNINVISPMGLGALMTEKK